jgi:hypothetical protein
MQAGHAYVAKLLYFVPHQETGYGGFFGYWQVAGSCANYCDQAMAAYFRISPQHNSSRKGMELRVGNLRAHRLKLFLIGASCEHVAAARSHAGKDFGDLLGCLAGAIDNFGHADAQRAMVIYFGETDIFERQMTQA